MTKIREKDAFTQKRWAIVAPITMQQLMLALISATDAVMLGLVDQESLSAVSLAGQVQFVYSMVIAAAVEAGVCWWPSTGAEMTGPPSMRYSPLC